MSDSKPETEADLEDATTETQEVSTAVDVDEDIEKDIEANEIAGTADSDDTESESESQLSN